MKKQKVFNSGEKSLTLLFTDFYVITRMFMDFDISTKEKIERSPKLCPVVTKSGMATNNITPNKIIVYAGDSHSKSYRFIIEKLFNIKPKYNFNKCEDKILDISTQNKLKDFNDLINEMAE